jgi:stress response protein SCP2
MHTLKKSAGAYELYRLDDSGQVVSYVETLRYGLRWEAKKAERKGLFGRAERKMREMEGKTDPADLDGGAIFLTDGDPKKYIGFGNYNPLKDEATTEERTSVVHSGDSVRGAGDGDDEQVDLHLRHIPKRYDRILLVGGAYKPGSDIEAVCDVKATVYDGTGGSFDAVGEFEPSLLGVKRMIAVARLDRDPANGLWSLSIVNESYDIEPGDFRSLLRGAMNIS